MAYNDFVQNIVNTDTDAIAFQKFMQGSANEIVKRRIAGDTKTLNYYLGFLRGLELVYSQTDGFVNVNGTQVKTVTQAIKDAIYNAGVANGVNTNLVIDASNGNLTQTQINDKNAFFYATVADMAADTKLKAGKAVITHGYWSANDGGGARYLISSNATDYSIPVANGLHAVFADSFDIRKFGIRNSATLDQTTEIKRMCAYADKFVYEIDFLNFSLQVPKIWTPMKTWHRVSYPNGAAIDGTDFMGMAFTQVHKLKNLKITHDKTVRLENCHCMIIFAPMNNPDFEQWFVLENIDLDAWNPNYQPFADNYLGNGDGARHGFFMAAKDGGSLSDHSDVPLNYSLEYKNINFKTTAYSYNLCNYLQVKNTKFENLTGEFLCLYLLQNSHNFYGENLTATQRDDLRESGRLMVSNAIHYEAELTGKTATHNIVDIKNIKAYKQTTGTAGSAYVFHALGNITVNNFILDNLVGHSRIYNTNVISCEYKNCVDVNSFTLLKCPSVKSIKIDNWVNSGLQGSYGAVPYLLRSANFEYVEINNSTINLSLFINTMSACTVNSMTVNNLTIKDTNGLATCVSGLAINKLIANNIYFADNIQRFVWADLTDVVTKNITLNTMGAFGGFMKNNSTAITANIDIVNMQSKRANAQYDNAFDGLANLSIYNSGFVDTIKRDISKVNMRLINTTAVCTIAYDPPSLATATQTKTNIALAGVKVGFNNVTLSFDKSLQGLRVWGEIETDHTLTVYLRNDTGATVDLPGGTLTVKIV